MLYALGIPAFLTAFFNVLFLLLYPMLSQRSVIKFYEVLFDNTSIIVILFYLVCMIIICTLLSLSRSINKSEIEIFRRN